MTYADQTKQSPETQAAIEHEVRILLKVSFHIHRPSKALIWCSLACGCITAWYGNCSASDRKALQRVVRTAQYITGAKLPTVQDLYTRRCQRKALKIVKDSSHRSHRLFSLLPHSKCYWSVKSRSLTASSPKP